MNCKLTSREFIRNAVMLAGAGFTALASAALARPDLPAMETLSLDGLWEFAFVEGAALADAKCDFAPTGKMPVPGCFDLSPEYRMKRGTAMYRTRLRTERDALNAYLVVKGMGLRAKFWIDGREIGSSKLAYSELEFETGPLAAGEHVVEAALDNRLFAAGSEIFQPFYDFFASGGFYHGIALKLQRVPGELDAVVVRTRDFRTGRVELEAVFKGPADEDFNAEVSFDGGGARIVGFVDRRAEVSVPGFKTWSPENPALHVVRVAVRGRGEAAARFGIREFKCADGRFLLNGSPIFLKGVNRHDSDYADGYATSQQSVWRDLTLIKGLGANFVRTSHYPPSEEFLSLCDEAGILVWEETLGWGNGAAQLSNAEFTGLQIEQARLMARKSINHPSVVIDAFLNEFHSYLPEGKALADKMIDALKAEDTGHAVSFACSRVGNDISNDKTDFIAFNLYPAWHQERGAASTPESLKEVVQRKFGETTRMFRAKYPGKPIMIAETGVYSLYGRRDGTAPQWSEDFQAEYLADSVGFAVENEEIQGVAVWQFADAPTFRRGGSDIRNKPMGLNMAGLFDEYRREKLAAGTIRRLFSESTDGKRDRHHRAAGAPTQKDDKL